MDEKIAKRMAQVQRSSRKPVKDKRYREYVRKVRGFLKNEINRMSDGMVDYRPMKIIVEWLDFRSPDLSKRMNRLIQSFGKRYVREKLRQLHELYGIEVEEVNAAYSSQECSSCGYVDEENKKGTQEFEYRYCGKDFLEAAEPLAGVTLKRVG
jgi:putative transposase